jgi:hypothetical protein
LTGKNLTRKEKPAEEKGQETRQSKKRKTDSEKPNASRKGKRKRKKSKKRKQERTNHKTRLIAMLNEEDVCSGPIKKLCGGAFNVNDMEIVQGIGTRHKKKKRLYYFRVSSDRKYARAGYLVHLVKALRRFGLPSRIHLARR